jgi:hypothetical protein
MKDTVGSYKGSNVKLGCYAEGNTKSKFGAGKQFAGSHRKTKSVQKFKGHGTNYKSRSFK